MLIPDFEIRSNREVGRGRADVLFRPRRPGSPGVVLELKVARSKAGLPRALLARRTGEASDERKSPRRGSSGTPAGSSKAEVEQGFGQLHRARAGADVAVFVLDARGELEGLAEHLLDVVIRVELEAEAVDLSIATLVRVEREDEIEGASNLTQANVLTYIGH